jgi:hypothetical protein
MIRRRLLVAILIGSLVAACGQAEPSRSGSPRPSDRTATPSEPAPSGAASSPYPTLAPDVEPVDPSDALAQILSGVQRDGSVPLETALEAFALLIGPLPGVEAPSGDVSREVDGTTALKMLLGHREELTSAQWAAVHDLLDPRPVTTTLASGPLIAAVGPGPMRTAANPCPGGKESPRRAEFEMEVNQAIPTLESRLGHKLRIPIGIIFQGVATQIVPGQEDFEVFAITKPMGADCKVDEGASRPKSCQIQFTNRGEGLEGFEFKHVVSHEVFHCFQLDLATSSAAAYRVGKWLDEGSASWVGETISGGSTVGGADWVEWLKYPGRPLFGRTYDGIGFFMHLQDVGVDPWKLLVPMHLKAEASSADAYQVAVKAASAKLLDAWGSSYIRDGTLRPDWSTDGLGLPNGISTPVPEVELTDNTTIVGGADPLTALAARIDLQSEAVVFEPMFVTSGAHGLIRFSDGTQKTMAEAASQPFCLKSGGCVCPEGSYGSGHAWQQGASGQLLFGIAGHTDGLDLEIQAMTVDVTCAQAPEDFVPEEPCWCPPGPLGRHDIDRSTVTAWTQVEGRRTRRTDPPRRLQA